MFPEPGKNYPSFKGWWKFFKLDFNKLRNFDNESVAG